jgi:hypothetical protein
MVEAAKMIIGTRKQKWPDHVENQSALKLNSGLSRDQVAIIFVNHAAVLIQLAGSTLSPTPLPPAYMRSPSLHRFFLGSSI